jgi:hypothetical protein
MFNKAMLHMNPKEKKELAISEIILIALGIIGLAVVMWLAWFGPASHKTVNSYQTCVANGNRVQESYPSVCVTKSGQRFVNPKEKVTLPAAPEQKYLTINEWGVRVPLTTETVDLKYTYTKNDNEYVRFTFQRLEDIGICKDDAGVALSRTTTENQPPFSIDNPEPVAHIGDYYYYAAYGGSPCYDGNDADQMKVVDAISPDANLTTTVKQLLQKLQPET